MIETIMTGLYFWIGKSIAELLMAFFALVIIAVVFFAYVIVSVWFDRRKKKK